MGRAHAQLTLQQQLEGTREDLRTTQEELEMYRAQVSALPPLAGVIPRCLRCSPPRCPPRLVSHQVNDKVDQSKQYKQLQQLMKTKNAQLKEARVRLARYETDDTPLAADD